MRRHGRTAAGTPRWRCVSCGVSGTRQRPDRQLAQYQRSFVRWLIGNRSLTEVAVSLGVSRQCLTERFAALFAILPTPPPYQTRDHILILDGVNLSGRVNTVLIARTLSCVRSWHFSVRECATAWNQFLSRTPRPQIVVIDGQKGLHEALTRQFPGIRIQRCLAHVERFVRTRISTRPKTEAGHDLWVLTRALWNVRTTADAERWKQLFSEWCDRHHAFLAERSHSPETGRWWYTHRGLRAARSHIKNALPYLFLFTEIPEVPRTTNHVEGGINSRLKELVKRHRGLSPERKRVLAAHYLTSRLEEKATRKFM
jgi:hypothetical protein